MKYITEMNLDNGIILAGFGNTEEQSITSATQQLPYTTNVRTYTTLDIAFLETNKLPEGKDLPYAPWVHNNQLPQ